MDFEGSGGEDDLSDPTLDALSDPFLERGGDSTRVLETSLMRVPGNGEW